MARKQKQKTEFVFKPGKYLVLSYQPSKRDEVVFVGHVDSMEELAEHISETLDGEEFGTLIPFDDSFSLSAQSPRYKISASEG